MGNSQVKPFVYDGSDWLELRRPTIIKSVAATSIADEGFLTVWTPATGKKINLMGFSIGVRIYDLTYIPREFYVYDGNTIIFTLLYFREQITVNFPNNGILFSAADNAFRVQNYIGELIDICGSAWGYET